MNLSTNNGKKPSGETSALLSRADSLVGVANTTLLAAVASTEGPAFVPERRVVGSAACQAAPGQAGEGVAILKAQSHKFVSRKDATLSGDLKSELGIDGDIFAYFQFDKMMKAGVGRNGRMGAHVSLAISVLNPQGKTIFEKRYVTISKESVPVVAGVYDPKKPEGACLQAIKMACSEFATDLPPG